MNTQNTESDYNALIDEAIDIYYRNLREKAGSSAGDSTRRTVGINDVEGKHGSQLKASQQTGCSSHQNLVGFVENECSEPLSSRSSTQACSLGRIGPHPQHEPNDDDSLLKKQTKKTLQRPKTDNIEPDESDHDGGDLCFDFNSIDMKRAKFPMKLHRILQEGPRDIIEWIDGQTDYRGTPWKVHNREEFSKKLLQVHFNHDSFPSFLRQVYRWGFKRIEKDTFVHSKFTPRDPRLCMEMERAKDKRPPISQSHNFIVLPPTNRNQQENILLHNRQNRLARGRISLIQQHERTAAQLQSQTPQRQDKQQQINHFDHSQNYLFQQPNQQRFSSNIFGQNIIEGINQSLKSASDQKIFNNR